ncbi:NlpC/P60 family protein [Propionivibrio dicarboxylicus]|uniref:NlpC/P60 family protein n=1 Tax=Propionivibrio dicarboxylicus TaxID=83767 RepID=A0A1G8LES6_9RHOO|nr:NlpC/P60 family protein [Propionivibrio dicarboxylicus]SDI54133.1 NlpC/P60 family protein [Propionivibrio dicarboxylicus]
MTVDLLRYATAPFAEGARGPHAFDCAGLLADIYRQRGIILPPWPTPESDDEKRHAILAGMRDWERISKPEPWCGIALRVDSPILVSHVGCVLQDARRFIHTTAETGVVIERIDSPRWAARISGFYRWPR